MTSKNFTSSQGIQVIARAAAILRVLKDDNSGLSLGQIADRTRLARSTVQRIVNALGDEGLVMTGERGGSLRLGPEIQAMASASRSDITDLLHPLLAHLSSITGETVDLALFRKDHMVFIDQIIGSHRLRAVATIGETFPMTSTANGKACLAMMQDDMIEMIAMHELRANGRGIRRMGQFMKEIHIIRQTGIAVDIDEQTDGISALGISFRDERDACYAISLPVPSYRFEQNRQKLISALETARNSLLEYNLKPFFQQRKTPSTTL